MDQITQIEFLGKTAGSGTGGCPSASRVTRGPQGYVIVGKRVGSGVAGMIPEPVGDDEVACFVPADVAALIIADGNPA